MFIVFSLEFPCALCYTIVRNQCSILIQEEVRLMKENLKEVYTQRTDSCDMANSVEFTALMNKYKCAIMEVETKLNVLPTLPLYKK